MEVFVVRAERYNWDMTWFNLVGVFDSYKSAKEAEIDYIANLDDEDKRNTETFIEQITFNKNYWIAANS